ncbi:hypothetical protein [Psychroserpens algicola]|nr:hypothetical protein [Psychroserpens algicola]
MKRLKLLFLFSLLLISLMALSCTPPALDDTIENVQATGEDDAVDDGSKD